MTMTGQFAGTPAFLPPEQITHFREVRPVSDIFSIAATLYYLLTGRPCRPVQPGQDAIAAVLLNPVLPIRSQDPGISPRLGEVIDRALQREPRARYQTAGELREALARVLLHAGARAR